MTPKRAKELLPIIQAFAEGKQIEYRPTYRATEEGWVQVGDVSFNHEGEYRIKPERRKVWVHFDSTGEVVLVMHPPEGGDCSSSCKVVCVEEPE